MFQSFALCAYRGPAASSAAVLITVPIVSEIQRIVHPPCDVVIRVMHRREQAQSKPASRRKPVLREKSPAACHSTHVASNLCRSSAYACEETRALPEQLVPLKPETLQYYARDNWRQ